MEIKAIDIVYIVAFIICFLFFTIVAVSTANRSGARKTGPRDYLAISVFSALFAFVLWIFARGLSTLVV